MYILGNIYAFSKQNYLSERTKQMYILENKYTRCETLKQALRKIYKWLNTFTSPKKIFKRQNRNVPNNVSDLEVTEWADI